MTHPKGDIKVGSVHILPECPPLHGEELKDRPVVVVNVYPDEGVIVVAVTTKATRSVADRIRLPDEAQSLRRKAD